MMRRVGLDQHASHPLAASRAARHLGQQLKGALRGAKVGQVERQIGEHHADQRHARQVEALGDHLRADHHVDLAAAQALDQLRRIPRRPLVSLSIRSIRACGSIAASASVSRSVPKPWPTSPKPLHSGQASARTCARRTSGIAANGRAYGTSC